jgi:hypothetical protein
MAIWEGIGSGSCLCSRSLWMKHEWKEWCLISIFKHCTRTLYAMLYNIQPLISTSKAGLPSSLKGRRGGFFASLVFEESSTVHYKRVVSLF